MGVELQTYKGEEKQGEHADAGNFIFTPVLALGCLIREDKIKISTK
jgi:hypothetical protein